MDGWILLVLAVLPGVCVADWSVILQSQCAVRGTSVVIKCSYDYPLFHIVTSVVWYKSDKGRLRSLSQLPSPPDYEYKGNKRGDCDLRINNVRAMDEGNYYFHFVTTLDKWTSKTSARLSVKELSAAVERSTVTEGDTVRMTCGSACPRTVPTVWFKDGQQVTWSAFKARRQDAGRYHCAVLGHGRSSSNGLTLDVQYAPEVAMSLSPPGAVVKGKSVTLTCSSEANPAVARGGYSFYKDGELIGSEPYHMISALQPWHSGLYHCAARNNVSRGGRDLMNSTQMNLDVLYGPENVSVSADPPQLAEGGGVNLTCSCEANPAVHSYTWFRRTTGSPRSNSSSSSGSGSVLHVGSGRVLSLQAVEAALSGLYFCRARNSVGEATSDELSLEPKRDELGVQPHQIIGGVAVVVLLVLVVVLLYWKIQKNSGTQRTQQTALDGKGLSCSEEPIDTVYANIQAPSSSHHRNLYYTPSVEEADVIYSAVTIKPRSRARAPQQPRPTETEGGDSVMYSTVVVPR